MRALLIASMSLLLLLPASAPAGALPAPGLTVGGGGFAVGKRPQVGSRLVSIRVGGDGRTLRVSGYINARCRSRGLQRLFSGQARLGDDGSFSAVLPTRQPGIFYDFGRGRVRVSGTFDGSRASGTLGYAKGAHVMRGKRRVPCTTARAGFEARDPGRPSGRSRDVAPGQVLYGLTTDRLGGARTAAIVRVAANGRRIAKVFAGIDLHCPGQADSIANLSAPAPINARGLFKNVERYTYRFPDSTARFKTVTRGHLASGGEILGRISVGIKARSTKGPSKGIRTRCPRAGHTTFAAIP